MESLLDAKQCANLLRLKVSTIYALVHQQRIPYFKIGRAVRFRESTLEDWLRSQAVELRESRGEVRL